MRGHHLALTILFVAALPAEDANPSLRAASFLGGSGTNRPTGIAADSAGNVYVVGTTWSADFPTTPGALKRSLGTQRTPCYGSPPGPCGDLFIVKLSPSGGIVWATYLGGSGQEDGAAIAVDNAGQVYITAFTDSTDLPVSTRLMEFPGQGFVAKLSANGDRLLYSAYLGGQSTAITLDSDGRAYLAGYGGGSPASPVVRRLSPPGDRIEWEYSFGSRFFPPIPGAIALDASGNVYVAGTVPFRGTIDTTPGVVQPASRNEPGFAASEGFVLKLDASGRLAYATYLGGRLSEFNLRIAVDAAGFAYVSGATASDDFPVTPGVFQTSLRGQIDAFVTKINPSGTALVWSTYLGGSDDDRGNDLAVDAAGNVYVTGTTYSTDFPASPTAPQPAYGGGRADVFAVLLGPAGRSLRYATYLGGCEEEDTSGIAISARGEISILGWTKSANFPAIPAAPQIVGGGSSVVFVARIHEAPGERISAPCIVNSASYVHGPVAPGELVSIFGAGAGPPVGQAARWNDASRLETQLAGVRILFDGIAAPLLYAQAGQINAVVPYGVSGKPNLLVEVQQAGDTKSRVAMPAAEAAPGVFPVFLNQDGTINSAANPARGGSVVVFWVTGLGEMIPPAADGEAAGQPLAKPRLPVRVFFGSLPAPPMETQYIGAAPGVVSGVAQINAVVPQGIDGHGPVIVLAGTAQGIGEPLFVKP